MNFSDSQDVRKTFEKVYTEIFITRFWDLPITNHLLSVQVVGLRETEDFYTFCLITPWMLNEIAVPKKEELVDRAIEGMRVDELEKLGKFFVKNVISPMDRFRSMEMAVARGEKLAEQLFSRLSAENSNSSKTDLEANSSRE
jgi:[NiFe] hydrogenase assembly HybE family chaperone